MVEGIQRFSLAGKRALVTGGVRGRGAAIPKALAAAEADVIVADRDIEAAWGTSAEIGGTPLALDVTDVNAGDDAATATGPLDIFVKKAGIVQNGLATEVTMADWQGMIDVNLTGVISTPRSFGRAMVAAGRGSVISISSIRGEVSVCPQQQAAYNAAKAGENLLTRSLTAEWAAAGRAGHRNRPGLHRDRIDDGGPIETGLVRHVGRPDADGASCRP